MLHARRILGLPSWTVALLVLAALATFTIGVASARDAASGGTARRLGRPAHEDTPPPTLAQTGLYADPASRRVDPRNLPYSPQYPLWSDGASKRRWISLPPGTSIDATDADEWKFPVGTRIWKEFSWGGRPVETRLLYRTRTGWHYASYTWDRDGTTATLAPARGMTTDQVVAPGKRHEIPSVADCRDCHEGDRSQVLGFGTLQLSPDRDPLAPHAEPVPEGGVTLPDLVRRKLVRGLPRRLVERPPRIESPTPRGRAALGYLHANCGQCHDTKGSIASVGLALRYTLSAQRAAHGTAPEPEPAMRAVGHPSRAAAPGVPVSQSFWIAPGAPARSTILTRMASRSPATQMPPLGTVVVDEEAVTLLTAWIREDLPTHRSPEERSK